MNKLHIKNNKIIKQDIDSSIKISIKEGIYDILKIELHILKDTTLEFIDFSDTSKLDIKIYVDSNITFNLYEGRNAKKSKIQNKFYVQENSVVNVERLYQIKHAKQLDLIFLNETNAMVNINFINVALDQGKYDIISYHNACKTKFIIKNRGVTLKKGSLSYHVTGIVYNGTKGCVVDQNNRILTLNDEKNLIKPVLLIEEEDVIANHSAYIGSIKPEELFYLTSRGLSSSEATNLIVKGYIQTTNDSLQNIVDVNWG